MNHTITTEAADSGIHVEIQKKTHKKTLVEHTYDYSYVCSGGRTSDRGKKNIPKTKQRAA